MAVLTLEQIRFLSAQRVGRLATVDQSNHPHVVPICFAYVDGVIYTPIDEKPKRVEAASLRRVRNIVARPQVCFLCDRYDDDWTRLAWLQVHGDAALVTEEAERAEAVAALRARYAQYREMDLESLPLIRITPNRVAAWSAKGP